MVFEFSTEFQIPKTDICNLSEPLSIKGYLQGRPMHHIMVDGGAGVNVMPLSTFGKMGYHDSELMRTNTSLIAFTMEVTNTKGVMSIELTGGSKTLASTFFVVNVSERYNWLVGQDWIHANVCMPSMLHQCLMQWVGEEVEVVPAEDQVCVASAKTQDGVQSGDVACLSVRDLSDYDYIRICKDGLVPVNVKPTNVSWMNQVSV
jgi:hypothetical protein